MSSEQLPKSTCGNGSKHYLFVHIIYHIYLFIYLSIYIIIIIYYYYYIICTFFSFISIYLYINVYIYIYISNLEMHEHLIAFGPSHCIIPAPKNIHPSNLRHLLRGRPCRYGCRHPPFPRRMRWCPEWRLWLHPRCRAPATGAAVGFGWVGVGVGMPITFMFGHTGSTKTMSWGGDGWGRVKEKDIERHDNVWSKMI